MHLKMQHITISASGEDAPIIIAVNGATITHDDNALASIVKVMATISRHGLLTGNINPIAVNIDTPVVWLTSVYSILPSDSAAKDKPQPTVQAPGLLKQLAEPEPDSFLSRWDKVTIENGSIEIAQSADNHIMASAVNADLHRTAVGLQGTLHGVLSCKQGCGQYRCRY